MRDQTSILACVTISVDDVRNNGTRGKLSIPSECMPEAVRMELVFWPL